MNQPKSDQAKQIEKLVSIVQSALRVDPQALEATIQFAEARLAVIPLPPLAPERIAMLKVLNRASPGELREVQIREHEERLASSFIATAERTHPDQVNIARTLGRDRGDVVAFAAHLREMGVR